MPGVVRVMGWTRSSASHLKTRDEAGWGRRQLKTVCSRSFREGERRRPPEPAVRPRPRRTTAVPGNLPHAVIAMPTDAMSTRPAGTSALCERHVAVPTHTCRPGFSKPARRSGRAPSGFASTKQPFVASGSRPGEATQCGGVEPPLVADSVRLVAPPQRGAPRLCASNHS